MTNQSVISPKFPSKKTKNFTGLTLQSLKSDTVRSTGGPNAVVLESQLHVILKSHTVCGMDDGFFMPVLLDSPSRVFQAYIV